MLSAPTAEITRYMTTYTLHSKANNMPLLRRIESRLAIIEPCFGIIKPVKGLNTKPNLGNVFYIARKSAATELRAPLIDATSEGLKFPPKSLNNPQTGLDSPQKELSICFGMQRSRQSVYIQLLASTAWMGHLKASFKASYWARLTRTSKTVAS